MEAIFSDVGQLVLDNRDDPDTRATPRRLSAHLRSRNRRRGHRIRIPYLADSHKH